MDLIRIVNQWLFKAIESQRTGLGGWLTVLAFVVTAVIYLGSRGWRKLAKHYPSRNLYRGEWISEKNEDGEELELRAYFNNGGSGDTMKLGADSQGLYLSMTMPLRLFHPPIFVPWREVQAEMLKRKLAWMEIRLVRFRFKAAPGIPLDLHPDVAREVEKRSQGVWTMPGFEP